MPKNSRRYITLEEVKDAPSVTLWEIMSLVEEGVMPFCAYVSLKNAGALTASQDKTVYSIFNYSGLVRLTYADSRLFAEQSSSHNISYLTILEPSKVTNWRSLHDVFGEIKGALVEQGRYNDNIPRAEFSALTNMTIAPRVENLIASLTSMKTGQATEPDLTGYLQSLAYTLQPEQLRIDMHDYEKITKRNIVNKVTEDALKRELAVETHPIKQIIQRILNTHDATNTRQLWNALREDIDLERRIYDIDSLIFNMDNEELEYFGLDNVTKTVGYRRFQNLTSEVRKNLHG